MAVSLSLTQKAVRSNECGAPMAIRLPIWICRHSISNAPLPQQFTNPVHCVRMSNDGLVFTCDRGHNRLQVFNNDGSFVREDCIQPETHAATTGSVMCHGSTASTAPKSPQGRSDASAMPPASSTICIILGSTAKAISTPRKFKENACRNSSTRVLSKAKGSI